MNNSSFPASQAKALKHNEYGVSLIANGYYEEAVVALASALRLCRQMMDEATDVPEPITTSLDECMEQSRAINCFRRSDGANDEQYLFQRPIRIPTNIGTSYKACSLVSCMVTFNMALANQLCAMGKDDANDDTLRKAAKLYELGFSMQKHENVDDNILFTLATVNNLGLIHHRLNDRTTATKCFEYMLSTLMYLTDSSTTSYSDLDGFFWNATTLASNTNSASASAA